MEARDRDVVEIPVAFRNVDADQQSQFLDTEPEFLGGLLFGVLCLGRLGGQDCLIHTSIGF